MNTFFTSDTHFGHGRIIGYCDRPWWRAARPSDLDLDSHLRKVARRGRGAGGWDVPDVARMEEELVRRWNVIVAPEDVVYHLGDFAWWHLPTEEVLRIRARLNGRINITLGNHDADKSGQPTDAVFALFGAPYEVPITTYYEHRSGRRLLLSHHGPHHRESAKYLHNGVDLWLHGHSHAAGGRLVRTATRPDGLEIPAVDLSVEGWAYAPVSLDEILKRVNEPPPEEPRIGRP
jgi:calcineurin-like phosphoesterase family protein